MSCFIFCYPPQSHTQIKHEYYHFNAKHDPEDIRNFIRNIQFQAIKNCMLFLLRGSIQKLIVA
ncbi:hypothetical protein HZS_1956 [Henneguya salminicola]|nr:hypothetical protein HZS_1956 [Henneguya salminicola]